MAHRNRQEKNQARTDPQKDKSRERNVGHSKGEEHSRGPKGAHDSRSGRGFGGNKR